MFDAALDMAAKKPNLEKQLVLRVDEDLMADLQDGHRALTLLARVNNDDVPSFSKALRRVIRLGLDVLFNKVGGRPQTEADWSALEASLQANKKH
ncbi:MAG TPA: hypothetical protein VGD87_06510 [Archangium sp.]